MDSLHVLAANAAERPTILVALVLVFLVLGLKLSPRGKQPPYLRERIPYVTNTIQYLTDVGTFLNRVTTTLDKTKSNIVKFHVGPIPAYIVTGTKNVQTVFSSPNILDGNFLQLMLMERHWGMSKEEIAKFANDKSGRLKAPAPGTENTPAEKRFWRGHDHLYAEYLSNRTYADALADSFYSLFSQRLDEQSTTEWSTVNLFEMLKTSMAESAIISLFGSEIIDLNPGFIDCYWEFDEIAGTLVWGLPKFLQRRSVAIKDRLHTMTRKHIDSAWEHFDWNGPDAESKWEPHFGSRLSRETAKWLSEGGFSNQAAAGHTLASLFGLNGNTVPVTTWAMIELIKDRTLFEAVRTEAMEAYITDTNTGAKRIDAQKLINLPLLQSLYIEIMRLHVSFNVTRKVMQPIQVDGYMIEKGALLQTCSQIAHYEDAVWATSEHPASEFWAWRHVQYVDSRDDSTGETTRQAQFAMKGRPSSFFPYGGGYVMCPGRHFAKQEIILAIAVLVTKFDIEFDEWLDSTGKSSDRPAQDDSRFAGFIAMSPDREMRMRWKRRW
ncbi:hypothetical protein DTO013E5_5153 [Penicillium roqueforti]|uniref:Cytochrome P450 n=1 Tax=Penicillium roqueforti (strain FM164) TaxID=1365484 RepID=W6QIV2_PENRF|nr:hypothetical protein DTO012A1_4294 [Penicillium roqueforti]CDM29517.1 Cytochrome P450 [Penicillium roqueforti FM164]KAI2750276.1 hypothetical protein DTO013F2_4739 [Penicillium roqueforti]KAI2773032.1 hypothetical protein DTO012A8_2241 [Penicillium roqueforti]KAI3077530.1 hypothetical protein CBS147339_4556 [Penicillium roqueforti]